MGGRDKSARNAKARFARTSSSRGYQGHREKSGPHAGHTMPAGETNGNHHAMPNMTGMDHSTMDHSTLNPAGMFLMGQSSGTAFQPSAWPMPMLMTKAGDWNFMWMGQAFRSEERRVGKECRSRWS